jgi:hypothetical protein
MRRAITISLLFSTVLLFSAGIGVAQAASQGTPDYNTIHLNGCPVQVTPSCLMMTDRDGTPYEIASAPARSDPHGSKAAPPSPDRHRSVSLDGIVAEGRIGMCKRGILLTEIRWHYTKDKCQGAPVK